MKQNATQPCCGKPDKAKDQVSHATSNPSHEPIALPLFSTHQAGTVPAESINFERFYHSPHLTLLQSSRKSSSLIQSEFLRGYYIINLAHVDPDAIE